MKLNLYKIIIFYLIFISIFPGCRELLVGTNDPGYITTDFEPTEKIIVSSPAKGEFYEPGELVQIKWLTSFSTISNINIFLYRKSVQQQVIIKNLSNKGNYTWKIPDEIDNSIHYTVKVVNSIDEKEFNFSGRFGILNNK